MAVDPYSPWAVITGEGAPAAPTTTIKGPVQTKPFAGPPKPPGTLAIDVTPGGAQGVPGGTPGKPTAPKPWESQLPFDFAKRMQTVDPKTGLLKSQYQLDVTKERAESPWLKQQLAKQADLASLQRDKAAMQAQSGLSSGIGTLARSGGATGGASAMLARQSMVDRMKANQGIASDQSQIGQDLRGKDFLQQVGAERENIAGALGQIDRTYDADRNLFTDKAQAYSAQQIADAMSSGAAGGGGGTDVWGQVKKEINPMEWAKGGAGNFVKKAATVAANPGAAITNVAAKAGGVKLPW
jgi:hypothetical protein